MKFPFLSEAAWINRRRALAYPRIFLALYAAAIVVVLALSPHMIDPWGKPVGTDFMDVWAAGKLALAHKPGAAYDYAQHFAVQQAALPWKKGQIAPFYGWHYPPMFLMIAAGLALLPYGVALALWMMATLPAYLLTIRAIIPGRAAMMAALAFPGAFVNLGHGQNGFLTCGLLGGSLLLLEKNPVMAGILFGLMAYKPQFGLLLPLALLAGGHWRAVFSAALTVAAAAALSYLIFGGGTWQAFFGSFALTRHYVLEEGGTGWQKIQSMFAAVRMLGGSIGLAYAAQGVFAALAAAATVWIWRKPVDMALKGAALATATLMATPYVLDYDLVVLALPIAWLAAQGLRAGFLPWEKVTLLAAWLLPLFARMIGQGLHVPVAPLLLAALLAVILRRAAVTPENRFSPEKHVPAS
jgi:alpha-1,2-mannosyltransferase